MFGILITRVRTNQWMRNVHPAESETHFLPHSSVSQSFFWWNHFELSSVRNHWEREKDKEETGCACLHNGKHWQAIISRVERKANGNKEDTLRKKNKICQLPPFVMLFFFCCSLFICVACFSVTAAKQHQGIYKHDCLLKWNLTFCQSLAREEP